MRQSLDQAIALWKQQMGAASRMTLLQELGLLDSSIARLEQQRRELLADRRSLADEQAQVDQTLEKAENPGDSEMERMLAKTIEGRIESMRERSAVLARDVAELDFRLDDLERLLDRRKRQRDTLDRQVDTLLPIE